CFFFQAEDGIRDFHVTGVQTCALPIWATADQVWAGGLIFARIGAILMTLPGFGESYVPPRIRLSLALVVSLALWPVVAGSIPPLDRKSVVEGKGVGLGGRRRLGAAVQI